MVFDRTHDRRQRFVERFAPGDLLEDLGLVHGERRGTALIGDVAAHRLELEHLAVLVDEGAVRPLVPVRGAVGRVLPLLVGLDLDARTELS